MFDSAMQRRNRRRILATLIAFVAVLCAGFVSAADIEGYLRLTEAAEAAHAALDEASDAATDDDLIELREAALAADLDVIAWYDAYFASDEFEALDAETVTTAYHDRYRLEYNVAALLLAMDRCQEARDRIRALLDTNVTDEELRPRLVQKYDDANACLNRVRTATLRVESDPPDATLLIDGSVVGVATGAHHVEIGEHTVLVRATGYASAEAVFTANEEGQEIALDRFVLIPLEDDSGLPRWHEWTLWGVGAAGIGTGLAMFFSARDIEDTIENPPAGQVIVDPESEQDAADLRYTVAWVGFGVGAAAVIAGTLSYLLRGDGEEDDEEDTDTALNVDWLGPAVRVTF